LRRFKNEIKFVICIKFQHSEMTEVVSTTEAPTPVISEVAPVFNKRLENSKAAMALKAAKKLRSKSADA